ENRSGSNDQHPKATSEGRWRVRFCRTASGKWTLRATLRDRDVQHTSDPLAFEVADRPTHGGFVRRADGNPRYLQFDSGQQFFPIGLNIAWAGEKGIDAYAEWFKALSAGGGNFARVWMCHPNRMTETKELAVGRMDLGACAYYDALLESA